MPEPDARSPNARPAPAGDTALSGLRPLGQAHVFLQTRRMTLFEFAPEQALDLLRLGLEHRVAQHILDAPLNTLAEISGMLVHIERIYRERPGLGMWYATDRHGFLGKFSLMPSTEEGQVEIGTRLLPRAWGRGYALEGGAALCQHAFDRLGLPALIGLCVPDNRSVPPLLERLGFRADGQTTQFGKTALRFRLQRDDWAGPRRRGRTAPADADDGSHLKN
jgi:RimJ/RimL family protein N-acetyltransferase